MSFQIIPTPNVLSSHIKFAWMDDLSTYQTVKEIKISRFAENFPRLFYLCLDRDLSYTDEAQKPIPLAHLKGIDSGKSIVNVQTHGVMIGICFYPYAIEKIFNVSMSELNENRIDLQEINHGELTELLKYGSTPMEKVNILFEYFYRKLDRFSEYEISDPVSYLLQNNLLSHAKSLDETTNEIGISRRHFERLFKDKTGISPKKYLSILRF